MATNRRSQTASRWSDLSFRALVVAIAAIVAVVSVGGVALAYLTATGSGTGTATTGTLNVPTVVVGAQVSGTSTVHVTWTAPTGPTAPTGYYVLRTPSPSGTAVAACGTSAAAPTAATSCSDSSVGIGTYTYVVVAVFRSWTATSAPSAGTTVVATTQSITFTSSPVTPTVGGSYLVTATGGVSGNPVTFTSATTGVCTVSSATVSFAHAGTCTINADQAGNAQYDAAPQVQQSFTVAKAPQTVAFTSLAPSNAVVGGTGYLPSASGGGSGNPVAFSIDATTAANCSISLGVVTYQHVGSCTVNANQAGNSDYLAGVNQQSYGIGQGSQAITFTSTAPAAAKVNGTTYAVSATGGGSGNSIIFSSATTPVCTVSGSTVSFVGAGTCTISANQAGNADYLAASQVQQTFNVTRNDQAITFTSTAPSAATYQGATYNVTASSTSGLAVTLTVDSGSTSVCSLSGSTVSFTGVGTCTINANQPGNGAFNAAPQVQQSFSVGQASQTITFGALGGKTFGNVPFAISATASSGLTVAFTSTTTGVCTVAGTTVTIVGGGLCTINANQPGNALYAAASPVQQSFTVAPANQTITFGPLGGKTFGNAPFAISATASSGLTVAFTSATSGVCTVAGTTVTIVAAGPCTINADQPGNANFNPASQVQQSFTVAQASQTISFTSSAPTATVGGSTYTPTATSTSGLAVTFALDGTSTGCSLSSGVVSFTAVGTCKINATQGGNANFNAAPQVQQSFAVAAAADGIPPTISNIMNGRAGLTWNNDNNGSSSWNGAACAGNQLCANVSDTGGSGVDPTTITFSLVGNAGAGVNAGKCYDTATAGFKTSPCAITVTFNSGVARATVAQSDMVNGTYTFVINAKDNAGNPAIQQTVTLTIT